MKAWGNGGNDKIFGGDSAAEEYLFGGDGDDKIWATNPSKTETEDGVNYLYGNNGNDILYGSVKGDKLFGDWNTISEESDLYNSDITEGGDDIIYTGVSVDEYGGSQVWGGFGNDKIIGQGIG